MIKMISLLLLALGALLAPAYWLYAKFYTGSQALLVELTQDPAQGDDLPLWRSAPFRLEGAMAPAGLILLARGHFSPNMDENKPPRDPYVVTLYRDEEAAQPLQITLGVSKVADSNPSFREHLLLLHTVKPGSYRIEVSAARATDIHMDGMQLQVRQHLHEPDPRIVTAGIIVFVLGLMGLVLN